MLINEIKFLGPQFMLVRWVLTVAAILVFSWIASKIVKDEDLPEETEVAKVGLSIDQDVCMGCTLCVQEYKELFEMNNKKAYVKEHSFEPNKEKLNKAIDRCLVNAIKFIEE